MQVRLLGPIDLVVDGVATPVSGLRRRTLLAVLALHRGAVVRTDRLAEIVWADTRLPAGANTLQSHVSALRRLLSGRAELVARPPGYLLDLPDGTDVQAVERLIDLGLAAPAAADRATHLRAALALWRGRPLADIATTPWAEEQIRRLDVLWLRARAAFNDAQLALGAVAEVLADLAELVRDHPFDERFHAQLMLALYRAGRQADALAVYRRVRHTLADELGIDPGPALRDLEGAILRQDAGLDLGAGPPPQAAPAAVASSAAPAIPAQLPPALGTFAGRDAELAQLDTLLTGAGADNRSTAIAAVSGTAGVGKTALAVHWAHRVAARFPDGQLYVDLRGFDPDGRVTSPAEAVRAFLAGLGVPAERIPASLDAQVALYRSLLVDKRVLVLLDNARDAEQVRPLLPGTAIARTVVTSRNQLTPLLVTGGVLPVTLDVMSIVEARELLAGRLGADRVAAEPAAVEAILATCARLPLALSIVAARAQQTGFDLAALADELVVAEERIDALDAGDPASQVRTVLSWSYTVLTPAAATLFRLLGLHPGPDLAVAAAASVAGETVPRTRRLLAELGRANLISEHRPGRYAFHDLLRVYAADLAHRHDPPSARQQATMRLLDHYVHTGYAAARLLTPARDTIDVPLTPAADRADVTPPAGYPAAMAWLSVEHTVLMHVLKQASDGGFDTHAWQLAWILNTFLHRQGNWDEQTAAWQIALDAATRSGSLPAQAAAHRALARVHIRLGRHDDANRELLRTLDLYTRSGDLVGQARTHHNLAYLWERQRRPADALPHAERALQLYRLADHLGGQADALNAIGWNCAQLGDHTRALSHCGEALGLFQQLGDLDGQANAWDSLGYAHLCLGHHDHAVRCYQEALTLARALDDRYVQADFLTHLGDAHHAAGAPGAASEAWARAFAILTELGHPDAGAVAVRLETDDHPPAALAQKC